MDFTVYLLKSSRCFRNILSPHLCSAVNQAMSEGKVPPEMLQATIVTLPKPGKSPDTPANFRPISLLNTDIKLYAKVLVQQLLLLLPTLIKAGQEGFIKRHWAPDGTRHNLNILSHVEYSKIPTIFLSLDAKKAFERIHWGFSLNSISMATFFTAINALYTTSTARVLANGVLSKSFTITNSTRQGCPLSLLIFDLVMEPLAKAIR